MDQWIERHGTAAQMSRIDKSAEVKTLNRTRIYREMFRKFIVQLMSNGTTRVEHSSMCSPEDSVYVVYHECEKVLLTVDNGCGKRDPFKEILFLSDFVYIYSVRQQGTVSIGIAAYFDES